ncbi:methionine/alanine import family NSS transporter small subunit [Georgenia sp. 311]|uniref:Methionine/alanine import family NSS transporter small subunit n=1 Tax=Georgenia wutianyii TaxID=2585135 RepID=A0ABX5VM52_9MICO|nr:MULTISPECIES: methionine/alanine import family NSS transporter small subunit [Georgenia]QDB78104.1 methionine/alanine import family NSS transporter small subunit [Georgenia wutianyii]TNC17549.1 methionine/alanine import family NSS transporter small subunit [Georgenia sp. 311]
MTPLAITSMIIAMLVIWGGLVVAVTFLARNPLPPEDDDTAPGYDRTSPTR